MKYWAYVNNEILGPYEKEKLLELPNFAPSLLVCPQTPVGEKTEDWKEAASYPELSALIAAGGVSGPKPAASAPAAAASPAPTASPAPAHVPAGTPGTFKPLTASSIDPLTPVEHKAAAGGFDIPSNRLGRAADSPLGSPAPAPEPAQPAAAAPSPNAANFDPLTLSQVARKAESPFGGAPAPAHSPEIESFQPPVSSPAAMSPEVENFSRPAAFQQQAAAPAQQAAPEPAPAAGAPAPSDGGAVLAKLAALEKNSVTRQDIAALVDPLRMKLDQMGEVISSMRSQAAPREIMDKLARLESAIAELRSGAPAAMGAPAASPAPAAMQPQASISPAEVKDSGRTVFGAMPGPAQEKPKAAPVQQAPAAIEDTGSKRSKLAGLVKKLFRFLLTLVLLAAVLVGGVIFLKKFNIFDATKFIPFPLPFVQSEEAAPAPAPETAAPQATEAQQQAALQAVQQGQAQPVQGQPQPAAQAPAAAQPPQRDLSPEIVYFTRTYKPKPSGPSLEDKLADMAMAEGADYAKVDWKVKQGTEGVYEISAVMPAGSGSVAYTFVVDYAKKTLLPADQRGMAVIDALNGRAPAARKAGRKQQPARTARQQPRRAAAPAKKAAPKKAAADDEYEYVYEEDDGTGQ